MSIQEAAETALDEALAELALAKIQFIEATARTKSAQEVASRLQLAVAALKGEVPSEIIIEPVPGKVTTPDRADTAAMSPEEFEAERKRKLRRREKEEIENNPLGHLKCPGCGVAGKMTDQLMTTKGGGTVRMLACGQCGNQQLAG